VDECEKGIRRSFSAGGCASAGSAEDGGTTGYARGAPLILEIKINLLVLQALLVLYVEMYCLMLNFDLQPE